MDPFIEAVTPVSPGRRGGFPGLALAVRERSVAIALTGSFLVLAMLGALHHEMWRDELHAWLLARDSANLWNVFQVSRYEAHFVLWRAILFGITRYTHNPLALQLLNLLLATATIWIVARFSPFSKLEKCLLSFGYFFFYEYCVIAQDYTMIVLLMVSFCGLYRRRSPNALGLSVVLWLLANTLPYGLLIALIFSALVVFDWATDKGSRSLRMSPRLGAAALIVGVGFACGTLQLLLMKASPGTAWKHPLTADGLSKTVLNIWRAYIPIPQGFPHLDHWLPNTNLIDGTQAASVAVGLSILLGVVSASVLLKRPSGLFLYLVGLTAVLSIQFVVNSGALRHQGFLFLLFVASLWIGSNAPERHWPSNAWQRLGSFLSRWRTRFVMVVLVAQVVGGIYAYAADWKYPYAAGKRTAEFLRSTGLANVPIVSSREPYVEPLSAYLDKPIYYLQSSRFGSYADLSQPLEEFTALELTRRSLQLAQQLHTNVVLVVVYRPEELPTAAWIKRARINANGGVVSQSASDLPSCATVTLVGQFGCVVDEAYALYLIQPDEAVSQIRPQGTTR